MKTWLGPGPLPGLVLLLHAAINPSAATTIPRVKRMVLLLSVMVVTPTPAGAAASSREGGGSLY